VRKGVYKNIDLQRIGMPDSIGYTSEIMRRHANETCGVLIVPWLLPADKAWVYIATSVPGALAFVLLFVAIQFTEYVFVLIYVIKVLNVSLELSCRNLNAVYDAVKVIIGTCSLLV
jgi:hypothetical protein